MSPMFWANVKAQSLRTKPALCVKLLAMDRPQIVSRASMYLRLALEDARCCSYTLQIWRIVQGGQGCSIIDLALDLIIY